MKVSKHLDWLSITVGSNQKWRNLFPGLVFHKEAHGRHGYQECWTHNMSSIRIESGSHDVSMGTHVTIGGDGLNWLRDNLQWTDNDLVQKLLNWGSKCSRIDLAIDCLGAEFAPGDLAKAIGDGSARLRARTWRYIDGHKSGIQGGTVDTGSPKSDRRFRFYDKRAEQRIKDGDAWVRLELQLRRVYAKSTIGACAEHGVSTVASNLIGDYLTWSNTEYRAAIADSGEFTMTIPRSESNRQKWLLGQVAQALASEIHNDPSFEDRFQIAVGYFREKLINLDNVKIQE